MIGKRALPGLVAVGLLTAAGAATAAPSRADLIPLGRSAGSGAVCQAVRDYEDPAVQAAGRRAWNIRCRGWDGSLGRLYVLPARDGASPWETALATRAVCAAAKPQDLADLDEVARRACRSAAAKSPYLAYQARKDGYLVAAEGAAQIADVLETGLRVVSGAAKKHLVAAVQISAGKAESAADFRGASG
jgi:hypothetical protein